MYKSEADNKLSRTLIRLPRLLLPHSRSAPYLGLDAKGESVPVAGKFESFKVETFYLQVLFYALLLRSL